MSIVTVGVGQCGCQLAGEFMASTVRHISSLHNTNSPNETCYNSVLFNLMDKFCIPSEKDHHLLQPRALLVDAESRVAESTISLLQNAFTNANDLRLSWPTKTGSVINASRTGSGNNFASGAFLVWPRIAEQTLECLRKTIEKCDRCRGCLLFMSLGGGTGSGVGSTLAQHFVDAFPDIHLLTSGVLPHSSGEASTQTYNCLLSLSTLAEFSDACILLSNDDVAAHCSPLPAVTSSIHGGRHLQYTTTSFATMNAFIADQLMSLMMPARPVSSLVDAALPALALPTAPLVSHVDGMFIDSLVEAVAPHPDYRMLCIDKVPVIRPHPVLSVEADTDSKASDLFSFSLVAEATWKSLFRSLAIQSKARECPSDVAERLPTPLFMLRSAGLSPRRGTSLSAATSSLALGEAGVDAVPSDALSPWANIIKHSSASFFHGLTPPPFGIHRSLTMLGASHRVSNLLEPVLTRTKSLLPKRAFVHLYENHGVESSYFEQSLCLLERLSHGYDSRF